MKALPLAPAFPILPQASVSNHSDVDKAARGFESLFAQTMIKSMRDASFGDPLSDGDSSYRDLYDRHLADRLSAGKGLGLAQLLRRQLSTSSPQSEAAATTSEKPRWFDLGTGKPESAFHPGIALVVQRSREPGTASELENQRSLRWLLATPKATEDMDAGIARAPVAGMAANQLDMPAHSGSGAASECGGIASASASGAAQAERAGRMTPEQFVNAVWPHAQAVAARLGVCPKTLVAQAALETGWGRHMISRDDGSASNNFFGIKAGDAWKGETLQRTTREFQLGVERSESAGFRGYDSIQHSFEDYAALLSRSPRYARAVAVGMDGAQFARALQAAGYATDPNYAAKISAIAEGPTLRRALSAIEQPQVASL